MTGPFTGELLAARRRESGVISTVESCMTARSWATKSSGRWPGRSRTSSSADASAGITLVLVEPLSTVIVTVFRRMAFW